MQYLWETEKSDNPLTEVIYSYELPHGYEKKTQAPGRLRKNTSPLNSPDPENYIFK